MFSVIFYKFFHYVFAMGTFLLIVWTIFSLLGFYLNALKIILSILKLLKKCELVSDIIFIMRKGRKT